MTRSDEDLSGGLGELEEALCQLQFATPAFERMRGRSTGVGIRYGLRPLLLAAAVMLVAGGLAFAAGQVFPTVIGTKLVADCEPWECGDDFQVTARIDDLSRLVAGYNVVVADSVSEDRLIEIASALAERSSGDRVIAWFFTQAAGEERHQFPLLPSGSGVTQPVPQPANSAALIATFDFPADGGLPVIDSRLGG